MSLVFQFSNMLHSLSGGGLRSELRIWINHDSKDSRVGNGS